VGLVPVRSFADAPMAVVQGLSMTIGWPELAEATLAIRAGALWVTANLDTTLPTERGLVPGNGSMVAALRAATAAEPLVAGKPAPALMQDALARGQFRSPLVVGDRLDTDIAGANAAGLPSLMVLTGVSTAADAVTADADHRPTLNHVAGLLEAGVGHVVGDGRLTGARGAARGGGPAGVDQAHAADAAQPGADPPTKAALGVELPAMKTRLHRARAMLRDALTDPQETT
jgi:hypothetical protein